MKTTQGELDCAHQVADRAKQTLDYIVNNDGFTESAATAAGFIYLGAVLDLGLLRLAREDGGEDAG